MNLLRAALALLLPLALLGAAPAGPIPSSADADVARFRSHVAFLADDLLEGRDTGSRGYAIAAAYVASQMEGLGLRPAGERGGWFQNVSFRTSRLSGPPATLTVSGPGGARTWEHRRDVLLAPNLYEQVQDVSGQIVFAGYGIYEPSARLNDYRGLDVRGKIVAILQGAPLGTPSELVAFLNDQKNVMASRHGAIGVLTIPTIRSAKAIKWSDRVRRSQDVAMTWLGPDGRPLVEAPGVRFGATISEAAAESLFAGAQRSLADVRAEAERDGAAPRGFALRSRARVQRTSEWSTAVSPNVVGVLPGSDPRLRDQYVILTAHLDHLGIKADARPGEDRVFNGALDNAAGIATMLEAARDFMASGDRPRRSVLFMAVAAEEKGLLGSEYFAHHPTVPIDRIAGVVDLDMPLLLYDFTDVIAFGAEHSTLAEAVQRAARSMGLRLIPDPMPEQNIFVRSDHYMFVRQGVPAILLATGFGNGGEAKWDEFLNGNYHNVDDEIDRPIHWQAGARYARLNYLIARELADADGRPRWYRDDFFGDRYAPNAPKANPSRKAGR